MLLGFGLTLALCVGSALTGLFVPVGWRRVLAQLVVLACYLVALNLLAQHQHGQSLHRLLVAAFLSLVLGQSVVRLWRDRAALLSTLGLPRR